MSSKPPLKTLIAALVALSVLLGMVQADASPPKVRTLKRGAPAAGARKPTPHDKTRPKAASPRAAKPKPDPSRAVKASQAALATLDEDFRAKVERVLEALEAKGWEPVVVSGRRTREQQRKILAAGRSRTLHSHHLCGRAADIMDRRHGWKGLASDPNFKFWTDLGAAARAQGLVWGGDWRKFKDVPHIQLGPKCDLEVAASPPPPAQGR